LKANFLVIKRLQNPSIIKYEALYVEPRKRMGWLVMEYVKAPSLLKANLQKEEDLKNVMFQIVEALSYLHRQDIIHRDIKPENILYDPQAKRVKIIDFGISKRFRRRDSLVDMWTITGTLYYRAPEMLSGGYREAVDVWATGVLLYKLVSGKTPFECEYLNQTIHNIRSGDVKFPTAFDRYSADMKALISRMLTRDAEKRPTSCTCLRDIWFSQLYSASLSSSKKGKNLVIDKTFQGNKEQSAHKSRLQSKMSLGVKWDDSLISTSETNLESARPYIRKVNGQ